MPVCMIGMSGGVDSSVAAYLLKRQGYDCIGVTMKLHAGAEAGSCSPPGGAEDAKSVCRRLGIPHYTFDFAAAFERDVIAPFVAAYESGATPNPCIACNRHLKFGLLWRKARQLGCDCLATGHYARIVEEAGRYRLKTAADAEKDQSYVLYFLSQEQLSRTRFPLGGLTKPQVREIALREGFVSARKPDSQDICFIPDGDYGGFLEWYTGKRYAPGDFIDRNGTVLGRHRGAVRYTPGQRKGLGVPAESRLYVLGKDMEKNTVTLGGNDALFTTGVTADALFFTGETPPEGASLQAKIRYRQPAQSCRIFWMDAGRLRVEFDRPQRAPARGQALVLYRGDTVVGGGTIQ